jgi:phosphoribosylamine--glycine ligase
MTRARRILVVGSGGREHALAWRLAQSPGLQRVCVAPGNAGTANIHEMINVPLTDIDALADYAQHEQIDFTLVGPEAPLAAGIVDVFRQRNLRIFGPLKAAAQLESSKDFAKRFMQRHQIPSAAFATFEDAQAAKEYVKRQGAPIVVKADGLAAGKGVVVANSIDEACEAIDRMLGNHWIDAHGPARVVIEEYLEGEEVSFIVMSDGVCALPLATSQDHKRLRDGDQGPNTGGMGAYSPAPAVTPTLHARVMREVITPVLRGMAAEGVPYTGFLYAGLMLTPDGGMKVLEFNCRLGDPETQPIMMRLKGDFAAMISAAIDGHLDRIEIDWDRRVALGVVLAAEGYPDAPRKGELIFGLPPTLPDREHSPQDIAVFHAGTTHNPDGQVITSGGRVLCVTALGDTVRQAQIRAYDQIRQIRFSGMQYRSDIGHRALRRA